MLLMVTPSSAAPSPASRKPGGEDVAALIKRQSQEFSDASAAGNAAVLDRYLDDAVVFMNESGEIATKKDLVEGAQPQPKGVAQTLVQTDFDIQIHDSVAVTRFTDNSTVQFHGQTRHDTYRSIEVWLKEPAGWKMISSQTLAVPSDPPAVTLPRATLDEYVGTYKADDAFVFRITRSGEDLTGAIGDGPGYPIKAELRDVLFTPGQPRLRRIVSRDSNGKVTSLLIRREGRDLILRRVD
jgi:ketosteroid isomerase-like protein